VNNLKSISTRQAKSVERYFFDMQQCFFEMYRVLENDGRVCIVIGNTELRKVRIQNAEVFIQIMEKAGFTVNKIIERPILNRILPLTRDKTTGRFTAKNTADRLAYPTEYIIIMDKI
jgi:DNA modification methylase